MGKNFTITRDPNHPERVVFLVDGEYICDMNWQTADEIARLTWGAARHAEEYAKANQIIAHQAILTRTGAPFSLSNNTKIQDEAYSSAQWDSKFRKAMPIRGVPSARRCGVPSMFKYTLIGVKHE